MSPYESDAQTAGPVIDRAQQTASPLVEQVQDKAGQAMDVAKQQTTSRLAEQKDHAAESLGAIADALRQSGQRLREQNQGAVAPYAERAAAGIERASGYLRQRDVNQIVTEVEGYARRQPAVFLGGAAALGLLAARFLKASRRQHDSAATGASPNGYGPASNYHPLAAYSLQTAATPDSPPAYDPRLSSRVEGTATPRPNADGSGVPSVSDAPTPPVGPTV
jgi:hypothetical protein